MSRIPCLVLAYHDDESIQATLRCLVAQSADLDLHVAENPSDFTQTHIRPHVLDLVRSGSVSQYFLFDTNISNNALEVVLSSGHVPLDKSDYVLVTDGDLLIQDEGWLEEQLQIMRLHEDVFACGIRLDLSNLPVQTFPEAPRWLPPVRHETELYAEVPTGMHLVLMRTAGLRRFLEYARRRDLRFRDGVLADYCYRVLRKKWVRTRRSSARHLTWDRYCDPQHPYTQLKLARSFEATWNHANYCGYERYTCRGVERHLSPERVVRSHPLRRVRELWDRAASRAVACQHQREEDRP